MGSGRDKKKKAKERKGEVQPGRAAQKMERKAAVNEDKRARRADRALAGDEDNLDALLARFALEERRTKEVVVEADCAPPSARVAASLVPHVTPRGAELIMFGGENVALDTGKVYCYADLYRYSTDRDKWSRIVCPTGPTPRSSHQAVIHKGCMYVWGGEFSSPNQHKFMHFRELWRLDLSTHEWDQIKIKGGPGARSGHRMALHRDRLILFGGFYDTAAGETRYYNDLWQLDLAELGWTPLGGGPGELAPSPRSGCQLAVHGETLFLFGGYVKEVDPDDPDVEHGRALDDVWALDLKTHKWERVKKAGMAPGARASFGLVSSKGLAFLFGGVSDHEARRGEDLSSEFHNDLYTFNFDRRRWYAAELRPSKAAQQRAAAADVAAAATAAEAEAQLGDEGGERSSAAASTSGGAQPGGANAELAALVAAGTDKDSALYKAAVRIQSRFRGYVVRKAYKLYKIGGVVSEVLYSPAAFGLDMSVKHMPKPQARINAQLAVVGNVLWLFGGTVEVGSREITLDDMWRLDLGRLDGWVLVRGNSVGAELFKADGEHSSDWEEDDSEEGT